LAYFAGHDLFIIYMLDQYCILYPSNLVISTVHDIPQFVKCWDSAHDNNWLPGGEGEDIIATFTKVVLLIFRQIMST